MMNKKGEMGRRMGNWKDVRVHKAIPVYFWPYVTVQTPHGPLYFGTMFRNENDCGVGYC